MIKVSANKQALVASLVIHALLVFLAGFWTFNFQIEKPQKSIEILGFFAASGTPSQANNKGKAKADNSAPQKIKLPSMRQVTHPLSISQDKFVVPAPINMADNGNGIASSSIPKAKFTVSQTHGATNDYLASLIKTRQQADFNAALYLLEGEINGRQINKKIIPEYPPGIKQNTRIVIAFKVNPAGHVTDIQLLKKSEPTLEKISIAALQKWQFEPSAGTLAVAGKITFIYELQ